MRKVTNKPKCFECGSRLLTPTAGLCAACRKNKLEQGAETHNAVHALPMRPTPLPPLEGVDAQVWRAARAALVAKGCKEDMLDTFLWYVQVARRLAERIRRPGWSRMLWKDLLGMPPGQLYDFPARLRRMAADVEAINDSEYGSQSNYLRALLSEGEVESKKEAAVTLQADVAENLPLMMNAYAKILETMKPTLRRFAGLKGLNLVRDQELFLLKYVKNQTRGWHYKEVGELLGTDAGTLEKRRREFERRRSDEGRPRIPVLGLFNIKALLPLLSDPRPVTTKSRRK